MLVSFKLIDWSVFVVLGLDGLITLSAGWCTCLARVGHAIAQFVVHVHLVKVKLRPRLFDVIRSLQTAKVKLNRWSFGMSWEISLHPRYMIFFVLTDTKRRALSTWTCLNLMPFPFVFLLRFRTLFRLRALLSLL